LAFPDLRRCSPLCLLSSHFACPRFLLVAIASGAFLPGLLPAGVQTRGAGPCRGRRKGNGRPPPTGPWSSEERQRTAWEASTHFPTAHGVPRGPTAMVVAGTCAAPRTRSCSTPGIRSRPPIR
jgi:hypothetical protein